MGTPNRCVICCYVCLWLITFAAPEFSSNAAAHQFAVGGRDGWVLRPSESYGHWAERLRFQVNDTLLFKYSRDTDSVLVVTDNDYDQCNTANPVVKLDDGNSVFKFDRSGPFFFITRNKSNCAQGQKLIIVVLAVRSQPSSPPGGGGLPPADAPAPGSGPGGSNGGGPPTPRSSAAAAWGPSVVLVSVVWLVGSLGFGGAVDA